MAFFIGDEIVLKHSKLSVTDKMVYFCLITFYNRKTAACYPRIATIAKRLNVSKRTVQRSLARLKTLNFLQIKRKQSTNEYLLLKQQQLLNNFRGAMGVVSDAPNMVGINKTIYNRTNSNFKKNKSYFSNFKAGGVAKPIDKIIFNGITLKYFGSEGLKDEYRGSDGELYTRNKLNDKIEKVVSKKKTLKFDRFIIKAS